MRPDTVASLCRLHGQERADALEWNYHRFDHERYRSTDPVSFVWSFDTEEDQELAAWVAAGLAYGRVAAIRSALGDLHQRWDGSPTRFLREASRQEQEQALKGFFYRWTRPGPLLGYLRAYDHLRQTHFIPDLLQEFSAAGPGGYRKGVQEMVARLKACGEEPPGHLLPDPAGTSACKRLAMWLRWMVREDRIDPGLWSDSLRPSKCWVPLDTHMFRIAKRLRLTRRKQPDAEAARRITCAFARICPSDPLRYDFCITRMGMGV